jgi:hypothetical protein
MQRQKEPWKKVIKTNTEYLEVTLYLKINRDKSKIGSPLKLEFRGFLRFGKLMAKESPHEKSLKIVHRVKTITKRNRSSL